jgi:hypothetical protein
MRTPALVALAAAVPLTIAAFAPCAAAPENGPAPGALSAPAADPAPVDLETRVEAEAPRPRGITI